jgi:ATP-binding cassette subfamily F protein uup
LLDEPTNDLDIPTLEVLEEALLDFPGAILLITHDRFMLDRIATEYLALDGKGVSKEFAGFEMWQEWHNKPTEPKSIKSETINTRTKSEPVKLSYKLQHEFDGMEKAIAVAEAEVERTEKIANDELVVADHKKHAKACSDVANAHEKVRSLYDRWTELEGMQN